MMTNLLSEKLLMGGEEKFEPITFSANASLQTWTVPTGIKKIHVDVVASQGGNSGGLGGRVECDLSVRPNQQLYLLIGSVPTNEYTASYNASDIRVGGTEYAHRVIVAGGGGSSSSRKAAGGAGGGLTGGNGGKGYGASSMGKGGTPSSGGNGGAGTPVSVGHYHNGSAGKLALGGDGNVCGYEGNTGAGGAGYYGGGSGAGDWNKNGAYVAGGGGGSSFADSSLCSNVAHTQGFRSGIGYITISMIKKG